VKVGRDEREAKGRRRQERRRGATSAIWVSVVRCHHVIRDVLDWWSRPLSLHVDSDDERKVASKIIDVCTHFLVSTTTAEVESSEKHLFTACDEG
jgi:hypothetical protein